ncbi:MAG: sensor hybrid histidine kinase [Chloroflexi bacterium]|nr:sensor hybrid histidine kinase [Chloroflexota bacterium]
MSITVSHLDLQKEHMEHVEDAILTPPQDLTWLLDTTNRMVGCRNVLALLDLAYDAIRYGLGYDRVGFILVDPSNGWLSCRLGTDADGHKTFLDDRIIALSDDNFYTRLLRDSRMQVGGPGFVYLDAAAQRHTYGVRPFLDGDPRQNLLVALRTVDRVVGYISVDNLISGRPIARTDASPLVAFANALAAMMDNVALLESRARRITDLDANLQQRVEHLTWLQQASTQLATLQDLERVLDAIYSSVRWGLHYDRVGVCIRGVRDGRPVMLEVRGTDEHGTPTPGIEGVMAFDDQLQLHSPDLHHLLQGHAFYYEADRWSVTPEEYRAELEGQMREQLAVALRHDGELVGYLSVDNLISGRPITPDDAPPLIAFAAQAALAVSRAQLWSAHEAQSSHLAQRVAELEWLREMSHRINDAWSLETVLDAVYEGIREGLHYDRVGTGCAIRPLLTLKNSAVPASMVRCCVSAGRCSRFPGIPRSSRSPVSRRFCTVKRHISCWT